MKFCCSATKILFSALFIFFSSNSNICLICVCEVRPRLNFFLTQKLKELCTQGVDKLGWLSGNLKKKLLQFIQVQVLKVKKKSWVKILLLLRGFLVSTVLQTHRGEDKQLSTNR